MPLEVARGIYQLPIPLPDNPLSTVNAYALVADDGVRLVDCGWSTDEAYAALRAGLAELGRGLRDIREILITHIHPDHFGLAARLVAASGAAEVMHRLESVLIGTRYETAQALVAEMEAWLRMHGVPADEIEATAGASLWMLSLVGTRRPDRVLQGGEILEWGPYRFEALWTPGHSRGLICLYDPGARVFLSSDHVLERTSPNIGSHTQSMGNPLADYLSSLRQVRDLDVQVVLPGHGAAFHDLAGRVDALIAHHRERCDEMVAILAGGEQTAYAVASRLSWRGSVQGWQNLEAFPRRMAVTETVAHLEYLDGRGQLDKRFRGGYIYYGRAE